MDPDQRLWKAWTSMTVPAFARAERTGCAPVRSRCVTAGPKAMTPHVTVAPTGPGITGERRG